MLDGQNPMPVEIIVVLHAHGERRQCISPAEILPCKVVWWWQYHKRIMSGKPVIFPRGDGRRENGKNTGKSG